MRSVTHKRRAQTRRIRQTVSSTLLSVLILMVVFTIVLLLVAVVYPAAANSPILLIGLALLSSGIGLWAGSKLAREHLPEKALEAGLRGLGKEAVLYNFWLPAKHVLIAPQGIFSLTVREQKAHISAAAAGIRPLDSAAARLGRFLRLNMIGNPLRQAESEAGRVQAWFNTHLPEAGISVQPVVVFTHPQAVLELGAEPPIPVVYADKRSPALRELIRSHSGTTLSADGIRQVEELLHIPNVR
jgi:hypothetical protein